MAQHHPSSESAWILFALFAVHFALVFVPRTFRTDQVATRGGSTSLVELGYAAGTTIGLSLWEQLGQTSLFEALIFSGACYGLAALCDFRQPTPALVAVESGEEVASDPLLRMAMLLIVSLTVHTLSSAEGTAVLSRFAAADD